MSFFHSVADYFSTIDAREENGDIILVGVRTAPLLADISSRWKTGKISLNIFKKVTSRSLTFDKFFAVEVLYILRTLVSTRRTRTSRAIITQIIAVLETKTWLKNLANEHKKILDRKRLDLFTVSPLDHQKEFFDQYESQTQRMGLQGYLLAAAPGSGKTIAQFMLAEMINPEIIIIVTPIKALDNVWVATLDTRFREPQSYWHSFMKTEPETGKRYYVVHYEALSMFFAWAKKHKLNKKKVYIGLDESHNFNEVKSMRTEVFTEMCRYFGIHDVLWASGTPLKAMGSEVIPLMRTIDPFFTPKVEERFKKIFGLSTSRGMDILANRIGLVTYKVEKEVAFQSTVESYRIDISIPDGERFTLKKIREAMRAFIEERKKYYDANLDKYHRMYKGALEEYELSLGFSLDTKEFKQYLAFVEDMHAGYDPVLHSEAAAWCNRYEKRNIMPRLSSETRKNFQASRAVYKYLPLKIQGEALGRILGREREACNVAMLQAIDDYKVTELFGNQEKYDSSLMEIMAESASKTLIFTSYVGVVKELDTILKKRKMAPLMVFADTNKDLREIITTFGSSKVANPLIATYMSLGDAVPVTMASTVIFLNAPFRHHEYKQALARVDRIGQEHTVRAFEIYLNTGGEPNISTRSIDIMEWSKAQVEAMMGVKMLPTDAAAALEDLREDLWGNEEVAFEEMPIPLTPGQQGEVSPSESAPKVSGVVGTNTAAWSSW